MRRQETIVKKTSVLILIAAIMGGLLPAAEMSVDEWRRYAAAVTARFEELGAQVERGEAPPLKCATPIFLSLVTSRPKGIDDKVLFTEREDTMSFTHGTSHFLLHYTGTGTNRVYQFDQQDINGIPLYIVDAGKILDSVWEHTVGDLGFNSPPSDGSYMGGGDGRMDVYFINMPQAYGATVIDSILVTFPVTATSYMFLENDYEGFTGYEQDRRQAVRVSAAHEFFHTVQFGIDIYEFESTGQGPNPAWIEMSATFMEEEHYNDINDYYNYLRFFFGVPQWSLRTGTTLSSPTINFWRNFHMYGSVVFPLFLSRKFGSGIIRDIWEGCGNTAGFNWVTAADSVIKAISNDTLDLQDMFQEFGLWNYFTGSRTRAGYFPEASDYEEATLAARILAYPGTISFADSIPAKDSIFPDNLGVNYIVLENVSTLTSGLALSLAPDTLQPWGVTIVGLDFSPVVPEDVEYIKFDTVSTRVILVPNAADYDRIVVILSVLGGNASRAGYTLTVAPIGEGVVQPNGGEELYAGTEYDIRWFFDSAGTSVAIDLSIDSGQSWSQIDIVPTDDLVYRWLVPETPSEECLIRISDTDPAGPSDTSDAVFAIRVAAEDAVWEPFPNPAWVQKDPGVFFKGVYAVTPGNTYGEMSVTIMTMSGEKVSQLYKSSDQGMIIVQWAFTNDSGETVAAGPYLAVIEFQGETVIKKFFVLR